MEGSPCSLDRRFSDQIAALLAPPPLQSVQDYYDELLKRSECPNLAVKHNNLVGKGIYANIGFAEGELILRDQMLVATQHTSNKVDCLVCSHCFGFIGSVEIQIGRKLYLRSLGLSAKEDCDHKALATTDVCTDSEDDVVNTVTRACSESADVEFSTLRSSDINSPPKEVLESLINCHLSLPHTKEFSLPPVISCPGGCQEEHYCSKLCAESDWETCHSLLCTRRSWERSHAALLKFFEHANSTNDIFLLVAKVISFTLLRYKKLKQLRFEGTEQSPNLVVTDESRFSLLLEAWKPISMGFKKRWWDCMALPDDVDLCNESSFREQIRDLAFTSLQLLKEAIFDAECAPLFSLEIYGNIIGMFELNNLDLVVASPVEDYFIYIDELQFPMKEEAEKFTRPFLDALGDNYSTCCQGTGFFPIQSCINHSCVPNAKAFKREEDRDGHAVVIALRPIAIGEEITISYIDEELTYEERQAQLADYGFTCSCSKCLLDDEQQEQQEGRRRKMHAQPSI